MKRIRTIAAVVALALLLGTFGGARGSSTLSAQGGGGVSPQAVVTPLLQYQGRLSNPVTGDPVADATYQITFRLYNVETGGAPLWTETENVPVQGGLFSNALGDSTPLGMALFSGQALWLAIQVEGDAEATPRQPVLPVAYALSLVPGAVIGGSIQVNGNLGVTGSLAGGTHSHSGAAITSGIVAEPYIASAIARDTEVEEGFVNAKGDTMTGPLTVPEVIYSSDHTHYYTIPPEGFVPSTNVDYNNYKGGAYIIGSGVLVAPVHLPQGAEVRAFAVLCYDNDATSDMTAYLYRQTMLDPGYFEVASVTTSGASTSYQRLWADKIWDGTVDNTQYLYGIFVECDSWSEDQYIMGVQITYTAKAAP